MLFYFVGSKILLFVCVCVLLLYKFSLFRMVLNFTNYKSFLYLLQFIYKLVVLLQYVLHKVRQ